jgi:hypothetical protein
VFVPPIPHTFEQQYMLEMVEARRNVDKAEQRYGLFSGLLDAAQNKTGTEEALTDEELIGGYSIAWHSRKAYYQSS